MNDRSELISSHVVQPFYAIFFLLACDFLPHFALLFCNILPLNVMLFFFRDFFTNMIFSKTKRSYIDIWSKAQFKEIKSSECNWTNLFY